MHIKTEEKMPNGFPERKFLALLERRFIGRGVDAACLEGNAEVTLSGSSIQIQKIELGRWTVQQDGLPVLWELADCGQEDGRKRLIYRRVGPDHCVWLSAYCCVGDDWFANEHDIDCSYLGHLSKVRFVVLI